jgi:hypothetical protein
MPRILMRWLETGDAQELDDSIGFVGASCEPTEDRQLEAIGGSCSVYVWFADMLPHWAAVAKSARPTN